MTIEADLDEPAMALFLYVHLNDYVTYLEVEEVLEAYFPVQDSSVYTEKPGDVLLWRDTLSPEHEAVVRQLLAAGLISCVPAPKLPEGGEAEIIAYPTPERARRFAQQPYWHPTFLRPIKHATGEKEQGDGDGRAVC